MSTPTFFFGITFFMKTINLDHSLSRERIEHNRLRCIREKCLHNYWLIFDLIKPIVALLRYNILAIKRPEDKLTINCQALLKPFSDANSFIIVDQTEYYWSNKCSSKGLSLFWWSCLSWTLLFDLLGHRYLRHITRAMKLSYSLNNKWMKPN